MTRDEVKKVMRVLQSEYPDGLKNLSNEELSLKVDTWAYLLADLTLEQGKAMMIKAIATNTSGFMPTVGQLLGGLNNEYGYPTESEAWQMVNKALSDSLHHSQKQFNKLPPIIQRVVGSASQLEDWSKADVSETQTVIASNFKREYRTTLQREIEERKTPKQAKTVLQSVGNNEAINAQQERRQLEENKAKALPASTVAERLIAQKQAEADALHENRPRTTEMTDDDVKAWRLKGLAELEKQMKF